MGLPTQLERVHLDGYSLEPSSMQASVKTVGEYKDLLI
jgi:hypothetical protein